jgi:predicted RNA methylase
MYTNKKETLTNKNIYESGEYLEKNSTWHVEDSLWKAHQIHSILSKNKIESKTICEVGCGAGEILKQLSCKLLSVDFCGYELSPQAYELCKTRETKKVQYKNINIFDDNIFFDTLLCIDVFEHVENYIGFIKALKKKADYKIFHIPLDISVLSVLRDAQITARHNVGHLHYFTQATALATLTDAGYKIIDSAFTTSFKDLPSKSVKSKIAKIPRKILYAISPKLMVKLLGGCSLIVLAK